MQAVPSTLESSTTASPVAAKAVDLTDAIAILKMIVGLDVNAGGAALTSYQAYAADVDGNGRVELSDAISVLKRIVGLEIATANWMFFNGTPTVADKLNPGLPASVSAAVGSSNSVSMTAVLRGDVVSSSTFTYSWALTTVPTGSTATLASATAASPSFKADVAGSYVATMTITDGSSNVATSSVTLTACNASSNTSNPFVNCGGGSSTPTYTIGGTVSGLTSGSLVLKNNNGDDLTISANSTSFTFTTALASGTAYSVTAGTRPSRLACDITNNTGTIASANVTGVTITCISPVYMVEDGGSVVMYASNATTGILTALAYRSESGDCSKPSIAVNPAGTFAYVTCWLQDIVKMYAISASTGELTALATQTVAVGSYASSITVNPAGTFAYVGNQDSNTVSMYAINATTGQLTLATTYKWVGSSIAFNPAGTFAYVTSFHDHTVNIFAIDATTGGLNFVGDAETGSNPISIAVNPAGTFAYVANQDSNTVSMYAINATEGQLTALSTPTVATGSAPQSIAVNPAGTFAYVPNNGSGTVSMYAINATTGQLTAPAPLTVSFPYSIAFK